MALVQSSSPARAALLQFPRSCYDVVALVIFAVRGHGPRHVLRSGVALSFTFGFVSSRCGLQPELW
jgi:hypothetical protein